MNTMVIDQRSKLSTAIKLAHVVHAHQTYNEGSYVDNHIIPVVEELKFWTKDDDVIIAGACHDMIEDTDETRESIAQRFGERVATLVWRVTNEEGVNRAARHALTYPKIKGDINSILIKLCDRLVNTCGSKIAMYRKEYPEFRKYFYVPGMWDKLWEKLDEATMK